MIRFFLLCVFTFNFLTTSALAADKQIQLKDLGFAEEVTKPDQARQELLDERTHKLKTHEILGPVTWALMTATLLTAPDNHSASTAHQILGATTGASYFTTAYFAWAAPNDPQAGETKTNLKIHKILQWVHLPLMVLTPIAGAMAQHQHNNGQGLHGLAKSKGALATALYATYSASFAVMLFDF